MHSVSRSDGWKEITSNHGHLAAVEGNDHPENYTWARLSVVSGHGVPDLRCR
jgi:hypothetical protein